MYRWCMLSMVPDVTPDWRRDLESATQLPRAGVHTGAQHFLPARGKSRVVRIEEIEHAAGGGGEGGAPDDGFTLCVSAAVGTTRWHHV